MGTTQFLQRAKAPGQARGKIFIPYGKLHADEALEAKKVMKVLSRETTMRTAVRDDGWTDRYKG